MTFTIGTRVRCIDHPLHAGRTATITEVDGDMSERYRLVNVTWDLIDSDNGDRPHGIGFYAYRFEALPVEAPATFAPGVRFRVTTNSANYADVVVGDEGVIHEEYRGRTGAWYVTLDKDVATEGEAATGRWYLTEPNMEIVGAAPASAPVSEDDALQAFRRRVVERMQAHDGARGSLNSSQRAMIETFLREDLGLGDVLDGTAPGMVPATREITVTFTVDAPAGEAGIDAVTEWVNAANPGLRNLSLTT